ncbi:MAG: hypothetical protein E6P95_02485 [Candidatus Moraniibacteriota bacterium]|nr:MAG: hypothetical protein E6P95_02485 [Candidatus Moranbacteria bacterium]
MKARTIIHDFDDLNGRIIKGVFTVDDEEGVVLGCPVPDRDVENCILVYCGCCASMSENGIVNLPPVDGESWGRSVGYVCRGRERDPRFHVNPAKYEALSKDS